METVKRTERGWAGHFILADKCLFRRNTLIAYEDKKWVISTVGNCFVGGALTEIGADRYYETMAFVANDDEYNDADFSKTIDFDSETVYNPTLFDARPLLRIYSTGQVIIGDVTVTVTDCDEYTDIDCELAKNEYKKRK